MVPFVGYPILDNFCADKIRDHQLENINLSSLRAVINCSEPVRRESHQKFISRFEKFGLNSKALTACYAMAESVFAVTQGGIDSKLKIDEIDRDDFQQLREANNTSKTNTTSKMVSNDHPIENTQIRIISVKREVLPERQVGQIVIKSNCMLTGYYNRPEEITSSMVDGWFKTGDLGYIADGNFM